MSEDCSAKRVSLIGSIMVLVSSACSGPPAPTHALAGTTFFLAFVPPSSFAPLGFEGGEAGIVDLQRGQSYFVLCPQGSPDCTWPSPGHRADIRFMTRVMPDPASKASIENSVIGSFGIEGQPMAAIDLPRNISGVFDLELRTDTPPLGQGIDVNLGKVDEIEVSLCPGGQENCDYSVAGSTLWGGMEDVTPYPRVLLRHTLAGCCPAAAEVLIQYPSDVKEIKSAYLNFHYRNDTYFTFSDDLASNEVTIKFVDPHADGQGRNAFRTYYLGVAFELEATGIPVQAKQFVVLSSDGYDHNGIPLPSSARYFPIAID